jgi:hypothetical protein
LNQLLFFKILLSKRKYSTNKGKSLVFREEKKSILHLQRAESREKENIRKTRKGLRMFQNQSAIPKEP